MEPQVTHPFRSQHARSRRSPAARTRRFPARAAVRCIASPAPHSYLSTNAGYVSSRDPLENKAAIPVTFSESAISTGGANLELWRLETRYDVRSHTYESPGHLDGLSQNWEATA